MYRIDINQEQLNTILAALRFYQESGMGEPANRPQHINDIATYGDQDGSLNDEGIDQLCEHLNCNYTEPKLPRVLITVSGGVADYVCDEGVAVEMFDWDNYNAEEDDSKHLLAVMPSFRDLAEPLDIPVQGDGAEGRSNDYAGKLFEIAGCALTEDADQPGKFCWHGSDILYDSEAEAEDALVLAIHSYIMGYYNLPSDDWDDMSESQRLNLARDCYGYPTTILPCVNCGTGITGSAIQTDVGLVCDACQTQVEENAEEWRNEVANHDTKLGFAEWMLHKRESEKHDADCNKVAA